MQIIATSALVAAVSGSHFAVGTALSKTEAVQAALLGLIILGDAVSGLALTGIAVSLVGVFFLSGSIRTRDFLKGDASVWYGVLAGTAFALCSVCFRGASLALSIDADTGTQMSGVPALGLAERAGFTLAVTLTLQTLLMGVYLVLREPAQIRKVINSWPIAVWVGLIGSVSSICWFTAMTLQNAAIVRALGQVELMFTLVTSVFFLRERIRIREMLGMLLLVLGILLLI
jgi:drug/metabolite transporter (DMT)-like permease